LPKKPFFFSKSLQFYIFDLYLHAQTDETLRKGTGEKERVKGSRKEELEARRLAKARIRNL
jgi:hypothetical protein